MLKKILFSLFFISFSLSLSLEEINEVPLEEPNFGYLIESAKVLGYASLFTLTALYFMPESVTRWDKDSTSLKDLFGRYKEHVTHPPVMDNDHWFFNFVAHPYVGAIYYMQARNAGYSGMHSFAFSAFISTFYWEYGLEAFAEPPSIQDLIITPLAGSVIGEGFFRLSNNIRGNEHKFMDSRFLGEIMLFIMDPIYPFIKLFNTNKSEKEIKKLYYSSWIIAPNKNFMFMIGFSL